VTPEQILTLLVLAAVVAALIWCGPTSSLWLARLSC
jgi:hypothetical protein